MKNALGAPLALAVLLAYGCPAPQQPKELPAPPSITRFEASSTRIELGESVTLSFAADNATSATITDQTGKVHDISGSATEGSATVTPTETSFFVLKVEGEGGRATAFVQVAVSENLKETFLIAVPKRVNAGEPVQLLWSAFGAKSATLSDGQGETITLNAAAGTGVVEVTPARTREYTLTAAGLDPGDQLISVAQVEVTPRLLKFEANPPAALPGEEITLSWSTRGATEVTLSEMTFGQLVSVNAQTQASTVDDGSFVWTVPDRLPTNQAIQVGHPLQFRLTVKSQVPDVTLTKVIDSFVGEGPRIEVFTGPAAASAGGTFTLTWRTLNAQRVQLFADGSLIYEPLATEQGKVAKHTITLTAPQSDTVYELVAWGHENTRVHMAHPLRVVPLPEITSFTMPGGIASAGQSAQATWTTVNATKVSLRIENGPTVFSTSSAAQVASGTANVYPGVPTTYVLEAFNDAGDRVSRSASVEVISPGVMTATPSPLTLGDFVTVSWDASALTAADVIGDPNVQPVRNSNTQFYYPLAGHVGAHRVVFDDPNDAVTRVDFGREGFAFPFLGRTVEALWVSTNGFVSLDPVDPLPNNESLDIASAALPAIIAPFWDDLMLGENGSVHWYVEGTQFPRRLIVEWDQMQIGDGSSLTFQAQLLESGELRFVYGDLVGVDAAGENASVGWRLVPGVAAELANGGPILQSNDEIVFFIGGSALSQFEVAPTASGVFTVFIRLQNGAHVSLSAQARVFARDSVQVNEVMVLPHAFAPAGRWIELLNTTNQRLDLGGLQLTSNATGSSFVIPEGTMIDPGGFLVVGESADPAQNGGFEDVAVEWTGLTFDAFQDDTLSLVATQPISSLSYTAGGLVAGTSIQPPEEGVITSSGSEFKCERVRTFGGVGSIGTPGAPNEVCYFYSVRPTTFAYRDISSTGTPLLPVGFVDEAVQVSIAEAPFVYFGQPPATEMRVCDNGWLHFGIGTSNEWTGKTKPSTTSPVGTVAPFWDDMQDSDRPGSNVYIERIAANVDPRAPVGHWIVQWHQVTHFSKIGDNLNYQVKLFDDGAIEFHYAEMTSGSSSNFGNGNSATIWIEAPDGSSALSIGINKPVIQPFTAYRFTPASQAQP